MSEEMRECEKELFGGGDVFLPEGKKVGDARERAMI